MPYLPHCLLENNPIPVLPYRIWDQPMRHDSDQMMEVVLFHTLNASRRRSENLSAQVAKTLMAGQPETLNDSVSSKPRSTTVLRGHWEGTCRRSF